MPAANANARITDKDLVLSGYHVPKGVSKNNWWLRILKCNSISFSMLDSGGYTASTDGSIGRELYWCWEIYSRAMDQRRFTRKPSPSVRNPTVWIWNEDVYWTAVGRARNSINDHKSNTRLWSSYRGARTYLISICFLIFSFCRTLKLSTIMKTSAASCVWPTFLTNHCYSSLSTFNHKTLFAVYKIIV